MDITGLGSIADLASNIINKFFPDKIDEGKKAELQIKLQEMIADREQSLLKTQRDIIVAELNQSDTYTKRARPTVIYAGLLFIFVNYVLFPIITYWTNSEMPVIDLPEKFWWAWTGISSAWVIGRTFEKNKSENEIVKRIVGK